MDKQNHDYKQKLEEFESSKTKLRESLLQEVSRSTDSKFRFTLFQEQERIEKAEILSTLQNKNELLESRIANLMRQNSELMRTQSQVSEMFFKREQEMKTLRRKISQERRYRACFVSYVLFSSTHHFLPSKMKEMF